MNKQGMEQGRQRAEDWWRTDIIEMRPGVIRLRGHEIQDLIGNISFPAMIWLMLRGELPTEDQAGLLGVALSAAVDHGPQAPSIAIARMAATCGVGINNAMASAINVLGDVHGGAGEQALVFLQEIAAGVDAKGLPQAVSDRLDRFFEGSNGYVPGLGHRFHPWIREHRGCSILRGPTLRTAPSPVNWSISRSNSNARLLCARASSFLSTSMVPLQSFMANLDSRRRSHGGCLCCPALSAFWRMPGNNLSSPSATKGRCHVNGCGAIRGMRRLWSNLRVAGGSFGPASRCSWAVRL